MNYYEMIVILDPNLDDSAVEEMIGKIRDVVIKQTGEVLKAENWGRRKLAYELNKHQKGCYLFLLFKCPPSTILELEKFCKIIDTIIKFMVVKLSGKKQLEAISKSLAETAARKSSEETKPAQEKSPEAAGTATSPEEK